MRGSLQLLAGGWLAMAGTVAMAADTTVLSAARIHTMDVTRPQAQAMAYDGEGRILALGKTEVLLKRYPQARRLDVGNAIVIPGLIDAHAHVGDLGWLRGNVDLTGTTSVEDVLQRLRAHAKAHPDRPWVLGYGWDQNDWEEKRFPSASQLDAAFPDKPVWLQRIDGHAGWANSAALQAVGRDLSGTWQPEGGRIERDASGRATGILVDTAMALVDDAQPPLTDAERERMLGLAMTEAVSLGLTGLHDAGIPLAQLRAYQRLAEHDALPLRITAMAKGDGDALDALCSDGLYSHPAGRLQMRTVKIVADGALGSRGAALLADYDDDAGNRGLMVTSPEQLHAITRKARGCGVQVATHAIGDRANREVLRAYAEVLGDAVAKDHRWRIEHAQVLAPEDLHQLPKLHVVASMQPTHATSDMAWAEDRLGAARAVGAYAWRSLRDDGVRLAFGSDFPVELPDPRLGLYSAVARADADGKPMGGWHPDQKLTAYEALRGFTLDAAYASFSDKDVGSLEVGKRADFVVLGADPLAVDAKALRTLPVQATYVDGKAVYEAAAKDASAGAP